MTACWEVAAMERRLKTKGISEDEFSKLFGAKVLLAERPELVPAADAEFYREKLRELGELD